MGKHQCVIFRNTYFEEHLPMATSQMTLQSACLKLCFWIAFKTISTHKNTSHFQTKLYTKFGGYGIYIFNPYAFLRTQVLWLSLTVPTQKKKRSQSLDFLLKDVIKYCCVLFDQTGNTVDQTKQQQHLKKYIKFIYRENFIRLV